MPRWEMESAIKTLGALIGNNRANEIYAKSSDDDHPVLGWIGRWRVGIPSLTDSGLSEASRYRVV